MSEVQSTLDFKENKTQLELQFQELCRIYKVSLDLIKKATNLQELIDTILDEYIYRLEEIPGTDLTAAETNNLSVFQREKIKSLVKFATLAAMVKENSEIYQTLETKNQQLDRLSQNLKNVNQRLRQLNSHYLNMLSFVSHELRSPLISILGFAELLEEQHLGELNSAQLDSVRIISKVTKNLLDMIKSYLDLAKIENGELCLEKELVNIQKEVIDPVIEELQELLARKKMTIRPSQVPAEADMIVYGDPELLRGVFHNLFSNAIKYGKADTDILYTVEAENDHYKFTVFNQGVGAPKDKLKTIFQKFFQLPNQDPDAPRGTGLGLFITKSIVEAHQGQIWAESEYGNWFEVIFTLPQGKISESFSHGQPDINLARTSEQENLIQEVNSIS